MAAFSDAPTLAQVTKEVEDETQRMIGEGSSTVSGVGLPRIIRKQQTGQACAGETSATGQRRRTELRSRRIFALGLVVFAAAPWAQTVYESKDKDGPVFSDTPSPGAKPIDLPPPNVSDAPRSAPPAPSAPAKAPPPHYRSLVITTPAPQGTVHSNTGEFTISARVQPPLRASDRVIVTLDGRTLPSTFRSTDVTVSEADWQFAAAGGTVEHRLQMAIVDGQGQPLIEAEPVRFFVQRAAVGGRRRR